jgi:transposase-like protein
MGNCPECHSTNIEMANKKDDGQGFYEKEEYICSDCNCEWEWEMTKTITKHGKNENPN